MKNVESATSTMTTAEMEEATQVILDFLRARPGHGAKGRTLKGLTGLTTMRDVGVCLDRLEAQRLIYWDKKRGPVAAMIDGSPDA
jgi:hypothetical protein